MLVTSVWTIVKQSGHEIVMAGAFAGCGSGHTLPVVSAIAKVLDENGRAYATIAHEVLYDANPNQVKSLLSLHQSLANPSNGIDDRARCEHDIDGHPGRQLARFNDKELPFHFDGRKCFFEVAPISQEEIDTLPKVYLNTQENVPFEPSTRTNTSRAVSTVKNPYLAPWKHRLGFVPDNIVNKTLQVTTQMVPTIEAETREHMHDHLVTRLPELKHRRVPDTVCCDTFFSSIRLV